MIKGGIFIKKLIKGLFVVLLAMIGCGTAKATTIQSTFDSSFIGSYHYVDSNGKFGDFEYFRRTNDGTIAYCIEPGVSLSNDTYIGYYGLSEDSLANAVHLTTSQLRQVSLIAYYGWGYNGGHQGNQWIVATQAMIWKVLGRNFQFTSRNSAANPWAYVIETPDEIQSAMNEIQQLMDNHYRYPAFQTNSATIYSGQSYSFVDQSNILSTYKVQNCENCSANISGNSLVVTPTSISTPNGTVTLSKENNKWSREFIVYHHDVGQDLIVPGTLDPVQYKVSFSTLGGSLKIIKYDADNKSCNAQGRAKLNGAEYTVYKENGEKVTTMTIDQNCQASTDQILEIGNYYVQETKAPVGYILDTNKYDFTIMPDNIEAGITLNLYDKVTENELTINKMYLSESGIEAEFGAVFEIYSTTSNQKVATLTIDKSGSASVTLPYDNYVVRQTAGKDDYMLSEDFEITVDEDSEKHQYVSLLNEPYSARLRVIKVDSTTGNVIKKSGIKFKIFDVTNNEYVCQQVTYPNSEQICVFETNENGEFITPFPLFPSTYRVEEVEQYINGYQVNSEPVEFVIGKDSNTTYEENLGTIMTIEFANIPITGQVTIHKVGEEIIYESDSYQYEEIPLDGVVYELYAQDDILSGDGILVYHANDLIGTYETNENGDLLISDLYLGNYCLIETSTLEGFVLDSTKHCFELKNKDSSQVVVSLEFFFKNYLAKGSWELTKTDISTGEALPNVKFEVYNEENVKIFEGYTNEAGKILLENLPVGKYYFVESESLDDYILNPEKQFFEIKKNGDIVKSTMENTRFEVPDTGLSDSKLLNIAGGLIVIVGLGYLIYENRKKKK